MSDAILQIDQTLTKREKEIEGKAEDKGLHASKALECLD